MVEIDQPQGFFLCRINAGISPKNYAVDCRISADPICAVDAAGDLAAGIESRYDFIVPANNLARSPFCLDAPHRVMDTRLRWAGVKGPH